MYEGYLNTSMEKLKITLDDSGSRPILFIGSGLSRRYINGPSWVELLKYLIEQNPNITKPIGYYTQRTGNDFPQIASTIVSEYQDYAWEVQGDGTFPDYLYSTDFSESIYLKYQIKVLLNELLESSVLAEEYSREIELLKQLNPHAIVTTNYDQLLETIFPNFKVVIGQQVIKNRKALNIGHILKIHGCVSQPEEIIISKDDYEKFKDNRKYISAKLLTYFMEHPIIFIGYSISDENIQKLLSDISAIVSENDDTLVNNLWFVEWQDEKIPSEFEPPSDKIIPLGDNKNIRVNYLLVNDFEELYKNLIQGDKSDISFLGDLQENIYNIIKSKTITDLEVDMIRMNELKNEESLARYLGFKSNLSPISGSRDISLVGFGRILDPEQALARFPWRITDIANKLGYSYWHEVNVAVKKVAEQTGFDIKSSNNIYHIDIGINGSQHRYSAEFLDLIKKVFNEEEYEIVIDSEKDEIIKVEVAQ